MDLFDSSEFQQGQDKVIQIYEKIKYGQNGKRIRRVVQYYQNNQTRQDLQKAINTLSCLQIKWFIDKLNKQILQQTKRKAKQQKQRISSSTTSKTQKNEKKSHLYPKQPKFNVHKPQPRETYPIQTLKQLHHYCQNRYVLKHYIQESQYTYLYITIYRGLFIFFLTLIVLFLTYFSIKHLLPQDCQTKYYLNQHSSPANRQITHEMYFKENDPELEYQILYDCHDFTLVRQIFGETIGIKVIKQGFFKFIQFMISIYHSKSQQFYAAFSISLQNGTSRNIFNFLLYLALITVSVCQIKKLQKKIQEINLIKNNQLKQIKRKRIWQSRKHMMNLLSMIMDIFKDDD